MICKYCGKEFTPTDKRQKYCSPECKANAEREQSQNSELKHRDKVKAQQQAVAAIKRGWLTIPDAPNYEINSALQVRNKTTGYMMKLHNVPECVSPCYQVRANNKYILRTAQSFRRQAEDAVSTREWYPVPSLNNLYEFNQQNQLRNAATKKLLTKQKGNEGYCIHLRSPNKNFSVSITKLRWEVFGELPPRMTGIHKPVIISKDRTTRYCDSFMDAAKLIANAEFYSVAQIQSLLKKRRTEIYGWTINYLENEITQVGEYLKGMQTKDPRQAKTK